MSITKSVGRPRVYSDASEKMAAFRERQSSSGYLRREVLMSPAAVERVKELSLQEGVTTVDVASALFEMGLHQYESRFAPSAFISGNSAAPQVSGALANSLAGPAVASFAAAPRVSGSPALDTSPIQRFFAQRKESSRDSTK